MIGEAEEVDMGLEAVERTIRTYGPSSAEAARVVGDLGRSVDVYLGRDALDRMVYEVVLSGDVVDSSRRLGYVATLAPRRSV